MARIDITGGDGVTGQTGEDVREALNTMFTELYALIHTRSHALNGSNDHAASAAGDYNKFLTTHVSTGAPILRFIADGDIPSSLSRKADLDAHMADQDNPHVVTKEQLGITDPIVYIAGKGINITDDLVSLDPSNLDGATTLSDTDVVVIGTGESLESKTAPLSDIKTYVQSTLASDTLVREPVNGINDLYYDVEVLATGTGITATRTGGTLVIAIPTGVKLISARLRTSGITSLTVQVTGDMGNTSWSNRWLPICQVIREDTGQPVSAASISAHLSAFDTFYINGLVSSTYNHVRLVF